MYIYTIYCIHTYIHTYSDSFITGVMVQFLVFFLCLLVAVFLIIVPILHGQHLILFQILLNMWWVFFSLIILLHV